MGRIDIFKCRMCNNIIEGKECETEISIVYHGNTDQYLWELKDKTMVHRCSKGIEGISDFVGIKEK